MALLPDRIPKTSEQIGFEVLVSVNPCDDDGGLSNLGGDLCIAHSDHTLQNPAHPLNLAEDYSCN